MHLVVVKRAKVLRTFAREGTRDGPLWRCGQSAVWPPRAGGLPTEGVGKT